METLKDILLGMPLGEKEKKPEKGHVTFNQFCVTNIVNFDFNFWQWVGEAMMLTVTYLCGKDGKTAPFGENGWISGFLTFEYAREILHNFGQTGIFLLRYSQTCLGSIGPIVLTNRGVEAREVYNVKKLKTMPLVEYLMKQSELLYLVPLGVSKENAFAEYIDNDPTRSSRYLQLFLEAIRTYVIPPARTSNDSHNRQVKGFMPGTEINEKPAIPAANGSNYALQDEGCCSMDEQVSSCSTDSYNCSPMEYQVVVTTGPMFNFYYALGQALVHGLVEIGTKPNDVTNQLGLMPENLIAQFNMEVQQSLNKFSNNSDQIDALLSAISYQGVLME